ncbi:hypothetical protein [Rodentibacter pneumotropicus]|uniref:hypothetical protein n=1 Tax=Rodentibacter pneumotropicus TaxID=758 RepID=UPI00037B6C89|nr:hypothetical protein [Rodentibacter pneumotropicus]
MEKKQAQTLLEKLTGNLKDSVTVNVEGVNDLPKLNHKDPLKVIHFYYFLITMFKSIRFITRF